MNFNILFFDLDNTLIDRDRALGLWLKDYYARLKGCQIEKSLLDFLMKVDQHGMAERCLFWDSVIEHFGLSSTPQDLQNTLNRELAEYVSSDQAVYEMLSRLSKQFDLQLISNGSSFNQRAKLQASGYEEFFSRIYISDEEGIAKPLLFEAVRNNINCKPTDCLMIGDNYEADILGAQKVGFKTCFLGDSKADFNISHISELEDALCLLN